MIVTSPNLSLLFTAFETRYWTAYQNLPTVSDKIATIYPVGTEQWVSAWLTMLPTMREWRGSRVVHNAAPVDYLVKMQKFELTNSIERTKVEDDTYGVYNPIVAMMGENVKKNQDYQIRDMLLNRGAQTGPKQIAFDGLSFFNQAHPVDFYDSAKGTYCNDYTGGFVENGVVVGGAFSPNAFATLTQSIMGRKSESGEVMSLAAETTMHAAQLKYTVDTVLQAQFMAQPIVGNLTGNVGATDNVLKGASTPLMWGDLNSDPLTWYQLVLNKPIRPFSWLQRTAAEFVYRIKPDDQVVFDTDTFVYGARSRGTPAWSIPWLAARSAP